MVCSMLWLVLSVPFNVAFERHHYITPILECHRRTLAHRALVNEGTGGASAAIKFWRSFGLAVC